MDSYYKGPVMWIFIIFVAAILNKLLNKQLGCDLRRNDAHVASV